MRGVQQKQNKGIIMCFNNNNNVCFTQGQPKEKEETPENLTIFSDEIPNTNSGNYGNRIASDVGHAMQKMEHKFYSDNRRKRKEELICY